MKKAIVFIFMMLSLTAFCTRLFDNFNIYAVGSGPQNDLHFKIDGDTLISKITTYHWNGARGASPGYIGIMGEDGFQYGLWSAYAASGQANVPNAYWIVEPGIILRAGNYLLFDSDYPTWSCNSGSGYVGMAQIEGEEQYLRGEFFGRGIGEKNPDGIIDVNTGVTGILKKIVIPSEKTQDVIFENGVKISIPGNSVKYSSEISIGNPEYSAESKDEDFEFLKLASYEIKLGDQTEFEIPLTIELQYDETKLNPDYTPTQQIIARRWDDGNQNWIYLPTFVDVDDRKITIKTDHLTLIEWVVLAGVTILTERGHAVYEKVFLDEFLTSNFIILYSKETIKSDKYINDTVWLSKGGNLYKNMKLITYPNFFDYPTTVSGEGVRLEALKGPQISDTPQYIMDLAYTLDEAFDNYKKHFDAPKTPIIVKVDSNYVKMTGARGAYEKIYGRIHINTSLVRTPDMLKLAGAHELFHAFQNVLYSRIQMSSATGGEYQWWLESTADWAACNIAWKSLDMMGAKASNQIPYAKQMEFPLNYTGSPDKLVEDLEYDRAYFIEHMVKSGVDFERLFKYVAANSGAADPVFTPVNDYLTVNRNYEDYDLSEMYGDYSAYFLLSSESPVGGEDTYGKAAFHKDSFDTSAKNAVSREFKLKKDYTTQLWGVKITGSKPLKITVNLMSSSGSGVFADVYLQKKGLKTADYFSQKTGSIGSIETFTVQEAEPGDVLYILAMNTDSANDGSIRLEILPADISIAVDPGAIDDKDGKLDHNFRIKIENIPAGVKSIRCEWSSGETGGITGSKEIAVNAKSVEFNFSHKFGDTGKYTLSIRVYDGLAVGNDMLAEKKVDVKIEKSGTGFDCGMDLSKLKKVDEIRETYYVDSFWDQQGPYESYYDDARTKPREKGCYKDDYPVGYWIQWYENGNKVYTGYYNENHMREGHWEFWYESGDPNSSGDYINGSPHGKWIWHYENGNTQTSGSMNNGKKTGEWQGWYENGNKKYRESFIDGVIHGQFSLYYETGTIQESGEYNMGEESGLWTFYSSGGIRYKQLDYHNAVTIYYKDDGQEISRVENW